MSNVSMMKPIPAAILSLLYPEMFISQSKEEALRTLRLMSQQDFGDDVEAWLAWAKANGHWNLEDHEESDKATE
jgi:hypothetical protein